MHTNKVGEKELNLGSLLILLQALVWKVVLIVLVTRPVVHAQVSGTILAASSNRSFFVSLFDSSIRS